MLLMGGHRSKGIPSSLRGEGGGGICLKHTQCNMALNTQISNLPGGLQDPDSPSPQPSPIRLSNPLWEASPDRTPTVAGLWAAHRMKQPRIHGNFTAVATSHDSDHRDWQPQSEVGPRCAASNESVCREGGGL